MRTEHEQPVWSWLPSIGMVLLVFAWFHSQAGPARADGLFPITFVFDQRAHHFFWCGHEISSPVFCTYVSGGILINGLGPPDAPPRDTTFTAEQDSRIGESFGTVPMIARLHRQGYSYANAFRLWIHARAAAASSARAAFDKNRHRQAADRLTLIHASLDSELVDFRDPIQVDSVSVTMTFRGWKRETMDVGSRGSFQQAKAKPTEAAAAEQVRELAKCFEGAGPVVVIANRNSTLTIIGRQAAQALITIREARAKSSVGIRERLKAARHVIPEPLMREIILAGEGGRK